MSERSMKRDLLRLAPWLGAAVGLSVILTVAAVPSCAGPAPDFSAPLVSGPHQGDRLTRDSLAGEVVEKRLASIADTVPVRALSTACEDWTGLQHFRGFWGELPSVVSPLPVG